MDELLSRRRTLGVLDAPNSPTWAKEYATMPKATENLISFPQESSGSCLDEILRDGARRMLGKAVENEVTAFVDARSHLVDENGHRLHGSAIDAMRASTRDFSRRFFRPTCARRSLSKIFFPGCT